MANVAVIDIGKSNAKVALVDTDDSRELQVFSTPARVLDSGPYPHLDEQHIAAFVIDCLAQFASSWAVDALTATTHGATGALIDNRGKLVMPIMDYEYSDIDRLRDDYERIRPPFSETGSPGLPAGLNLGAQIHWQQQRFPDVFAKASSLLSWPQYWVHWLSGARVNDVTSLGCHTDLHAPLAGTASSIFSRTDWGSLMPPTAHSGCLAGPLDALIAARTGLSSQLPVHVGIHDSNASLVPYLGGAESSFSVLSTGTWVIAMAMGGKEIELDERRDSLLNVNAHGAAVPSARFMGGRERQELLRQCEIDTLAVADLDKLLVQLMQDEIYIMPSHVEGTGPYPRASGLCTGQVAVSDAERVCAVALYLALMSDECLRLIGARGTTYVEGPLAHDSAFAQMLAAATDRPVSLSQSMTGTTAGAAMLIARPVHNSRNSLLETPPDRRRLLQEYARRWREQLQLHVHGHSRF